MRETSFRYFCFFFFIKIPAFVPYMQNSSVDWKYHTEPCTTGGLGLIDGRSFWPRGKMLGGSSAMNAMLYIRGNARDFNDWRAAGNPTWGWDDVMPFFKKSENNMRSPNEIDAEFHGFDGLLNVGPYGSNAADEEIKQIMHNAFMELGFDALDDINGDRFLGFGRSDGSLANGMRQSAAKAYLNQHLVGKRSNLHVIKMAHVTRIVVDDDTKRATGVEFVLGNELNRPFTATTNKEVILSAGALNSPQILMLSGIGPADQLHKLQIPIALNAPGVGGNLQDHLLIPYVVALHKSTARERSLNDLSDGYYQYLINRIGILSNLGSTDYTGFVSTVNDPLYPDIQYMNFLFGKGMTDTVTHLLQCFNYKNDIIDSIVAANRQTKTLLIFAVLLNPKSRGTVRLHSRHPFDAPKIFTNYFHEQSDVDTVVRGLQLLHRITLTDTFKAHEGEVVRVNIAGCSHLNDSESNEYWECYARHMATTVYHPVGTVKMGTKDDAEAVVDATLKVKGLTGLRVADASIMPTIVSANTNAAAIMIGEKAADFIVNEWMSEATLKDEL